MQPFPTADFRAALLAGCSPCRLIWDDNRITSAWKISEEAMRWIDAQETTAMFEPRNDLATELAFRHNARIAQDASDLAPGSFVMIPFATLHGMKKQRARVVRILSDGRIEVKGVTDGGYHVLHRDEIARDAEMATDPPVSPEQQRAMCAAKEGRSNLGIPKSVGAEYCEPIKK